MNRGFAVEYFPVEFLEDDELLNRWREDDPGMGDVIRYCAAFIPISAFLLRHLPMPWYRFLSMTTRGIILLHWRMEISES